MKLHTPRFWQRRRGVALLLYPLSSLFRLLVWLRRLGFRFGLKKSYRASVPVIVIGNVSVGGAGKTPLVIALANLLQRNGWQVGIVSRGYGGSESVSGPTIAGADADYSLVGDEAIILARRTGCVVAVGSNRSAAVHLLTREHACNVIVCDDGLQHYALARDMEICVIDGKAGLGNGWCLPAGPLREPPARLKEVDLIVYSGVAQAVAEGSVEAAVRGRIGRQLGRQLQSKPQAVYRLQVESVVNLQDPTSRRRLEEFKDRPVHAVAAIGRPEKFFDHLRSAGLDITEHAFPDHHVYKPADLNFGDTRDVLMTEKDSVKCEDWPRANLWSVKVAAELDNVTINTVNSLLTSHLKNHLNNPGASVDTVKEAMGSVPHASETRRRRPL